MRILGTAYVLGLSVAAVLGTINILAIRTGLERGFRLAFLVGLGATVADGLYTLLAALGASAVVGRAGVRTLLWSLGAGMLAYLGGAGLLRSLRRPVLLEGRATGATAWGCFLGALGATLGNPMTVVSWAAVFGGLYAGMLEQVTTGLTLRLVTGVTLGTLTWFTALAAALQAGGRFVTPAALRTVSVTSSGILLGFAAYFGWQAVRGLTG
ncbi:MAG: LysE family transporter [candidate division NC10 bacterium]|nr:LysE family transporter [candidate division NC10 bacterium]